jgi:hypothetical protein
MAIDPKLIAALPIILKSRGQCQNNDCGRRARFIGDRLYPASDGKEYSRIPALTEEFLLLEPWDRLDERAGGDLNLPFP